MRKPFTKITGAWLVLALLTAGCATLPGNNGGAERRADRSEQVEAPAAEITQAGLPASTVKVPPLRSGNQALFERAVSLMQEKNYTAAQVLLLELTDDQPELAGPWVNLGHTYLAADDGEAAQQSFARALQANPQNCDALNQLGVMARKRGEFAAAEDFYQRCIKAQPGYAPVHLNLGILYELYMGRLSEALAAYNDYQVTLPEPDVRVAGWVLDLERRVGAIAQR